MGPNILWALLHIFRGSWPPAHDLYPLHANYINKYTSLKYQYKKNRLSLIGWVIDRAVDTCRRWLRSGWVLTQCSTWRRRPPTCHTAHRPAPTPRCLPVQQSHRWWRPVTIYACKKVHVKITKKLSWCRQTRATPCYVVVQNLVTIGRCAAELLRIFDFQNGGRPPSWIWYDVIADHPRLVFDGPNIILKLHVDHFNILRDIAIFIFGPFGLKLPIHAHFWWVLGIWRVPLGIGYRCRRSKTRVLGHSLANETVVQLRPKSTTGNGFSLKYIRDFCTLVWSISKFCCSTFCAS